ncbi:hypothetical protein PPTS312_28780 [Pseudomonas putida]|uniref:Uncharacterized protein n=1 Tax=Pseudomonas putida TaxID=303 RepID=A0A7U6M2V8_PSEPU|nr:hypothetical protein PPTS312_28780 [Pseudomonas putida]
MLTAQAAGFSAAGQRQTQTDFGFCEVGGLVEGELCEGSQCNGVLRSTRGWAMHRDAGQFGVVADGSGGDGAQVGQLAGSDGCRTGLGVHWRIPPDVPLMN